MGFAASSYQLFKSITDPLADNYLKEEGRRVLSNFNLYGLIIVDPEKDPDFQYSIRINFNQLSKSTGNKFLFFAVIKSDLKDAFLYKNFFDLESWYGDQAAEPTDNISLSVQALCTQFGIKYSETPCIIITTNLEDRAFSVVRTTTKMIDFQLNLLGNLATEYENKSLNNSHLKQTLDDWSKFYIPFINTDHYTLEDPLSIALDNFLKHIKASQYNAPISLSRELTSEFKRKYLIYKKEYKGEKLSKITTLISLIGVQSSSEKEMYSGRNVSEHRSEMVFAEPLCKIDTQENSINRMENISGLEVESKNYLKAARRFLSMLLDDPELQSIDDFSSYCILLCKAFELEINLSVVQYLRDYLGIEMPEFFNTIKPVKNSYPYLASEFFPDPRPIPFNKKSNQRWLPPGLGESNLCFRSLLVRDPQNKINSFFANPEVFGLVWRSINKTRQISAHPNPVTNKDKNMLERNLLHLLSNGMFNEMMKLKNTLRGSDYLE